MRREGSRAAKLSRVGTRFKMRAELVSVADLERMNFPGGAAPEFERRPAEPARTRVHLLPSGEHQVRAIRRQYDVHSPVRRAKVLVRPHAELMKRAERRVAGFSFSALEVAERDDVPRRTELASLRMASNSANDGGRIADFDRLAHESAQSVELRDDRVQPCGDGVTEQRGDANGQQRQADRQRVLLHPCDSCQCFSHRFLPSLRSARSLRRGRNRCVPQRDLGHAQDISA